MINAIQKNIFDCKEDIVDFVVFAIILELINEVGEKFVIDETRKSNV